MGGGGKSIIKTKPYTYTASGCNIMCTATDLILPSATKITACSVVAAIFVRPVTTLPNSAGQMELSRCETSSRTPEHLLAGGAGQGRGGGDHYTQCTTHTTDYTPDC